jgi:hypothetical protein
MPGLEETEEIASLTKQLHEYCKHARQAAERLKEQYLDIEKQENFEMYKDTNYWYLLIHREALIKIVNIIEIDLRFSTTFSVLTSARYLMENAHMASFNCKRSGKIHNVFHSSPVL